MSDTKLVLLEERYDNIKTQLGRFQSHLESEQRVTGNISKRVDTFEHFMKTQHELLLKFDRIIFNEGKGLTYRVDRLENQSSNSKDKHRWNTATIISILSLLTSLGTIIVMIWK